jgi:hypothetical protein
MLTRIQDVFPHDDAVARSVLAHLFEGAAAIRFYRDTFPEV